MMKILVVEDHRGTLTAFQQILTNAGHEVVSTSLGLEGIQIINQDHPDLVIADVHLPDVSGLNILQEARKADHAIPVVMISGLANIREAVAAMQLGASEFLETPIRADDLLRVVAESVEATRVRKPARSVRSRSQEAHASARWARLLLPVIDSPTDPRTVEGWSRLAAVSPGALRNWCRMAGMSPRRSLVFARLLRAVFLSEYGSHRLANLLDTVDRRTLNRLIRLAGFANDRELPSQVDAFLVQQVLVRDADTLAEVRRALEEHRRERQEEPQNE